MVTTAKSHASRSSSVSRIRILFMAYSGVDKPIARGQPAPIAPQLGEKTASPGLGPSARPAARQLWMTVRGELQHRKPAMLRLADCKRRGAGVTRKEARLAGRLGEAGGTESRFGCRYSIRGFRTPECAPEHQGRPWP